MPKITNLPKTYELDQQAIQKIEEEKSSCLDVKSSSNIHIDYFFTIQQYITARDDLETAKQIWKNRNKEQRWCDLSDSLEKAKKTELKALENLRSILKLKKSMLP